MGFDAVANLGVVVKTGMGHHFCFFLLWFKKNRVNKKGVAFPPTLFIHTISTHPRSILNEKVNEPWKGKKSVRKIIKDNEEKSGENDCCSLFLS